MLSAYGISITMLKLILENMYDIMLWNVLKHLGIERNKMNLDCFGKMCYVSDIESVGASLAEIDAKFEEFPVFLQYSHALITDYGEKFLGCHQVSTGNLADIVLTIHVITRQH
ncbi:hypothetical protein GEMRC1_011275 [Eukaryota sp. GEM-RC1]